MSTTIASAPASCSAAARSIPFSPVPVAAATLSLPLSSLHESGWLRSLSISRTVINPRHLSPSATSSFSILWWCIRRLASSGSTSIGTVTSSLVISEPTFSESSSTKRMSRLVIMPTSLPSSITGRPENPCFPFRFRKSPMEVSGVVVTGSMTIPASNLLTLLTCSACCSASIFLWITPIPPA